jgi:hypothetical protein
MVVIMFIFDFKAYEEKRKLEEQRQKENKICLKQAKEKIEKETKMTFIEWFYDFKHKNNFICGHMYYAICDYMQANDIRYSRENIDIIDDRIVEDEEFLMEFLLESDYICDEIYNYIYELDEDFEFDLSDKGC